MTIIPHPAMTDAIGRRMRKLRVSLLDACNMRCGYCMPDNPQFLHHTKWLSADGLIRITGNLVNLGVEEIRLTGGEPTLRSDFMQVVAGMSELPMQKLGLTTNGLLLEKFLDALADTNCRHLNISLDSLDTENFKRITKIDGLEKVLTAIRRARNLGFHVKVNMVVMRGVNEHEVLDMVDFAAQERVSVRFLEAMNIGVMKPKFAAQFIPSHEMIATIRTHYTLTKQPDPVDFTAYTFTTDHGADIGFIASESEAFCGTCSRLRLTPVGHLRPCLFTDVGINLTTLNADEYPQAIAAILLKKPTGRIEHVSQPMYQIGG